MRQAIGEKQTQDIELQREEVANWAKGLEEMAERIRHHFPSRPTFKRAVQYLQGLLSPVERKNGWQLSESTGDETPYGIQNLLSRVEWDAQAVRDDLQKYVVEHLADAHGIFVVDETGFLKKGEKSVGVQRQYSGTAGRIENCQIGVFLGYVTSKGHTLIDRELYLPESWAKDGARRQEACVPKEVTFQTKPQLARQMLARAFEQGIPGEWVTGDEIYGDNGHLRRWLEEQHHPFVLAVSSNTCVWIGFNQWRVNALEKVLSETDWKRVSAGAGSKGYRWYDWARVQLNSAEAPQWERWALFRRSVEDPTEIAYYLVFAPQGTSLAEMVRVAGSRWAIEICFESAKGQVGLDQYEVRKWPGWYHHMTLAMMAHAFLTVVSSQANRQNAQKGGPDSRRSLSSMSKFKRARGLCSH